MLPSSALPFLKSKRGALLLISLALAVTTLGVVLFGFVDVSVSININHNMSDEDWQTWNETRFEEMMEDMKNVEYETPLFERLQRHFPYERLEPMSKKILQTWHEEIPLNDDMKSWTIDPEFKYNLLDSPKGYRLILHEFGPFFPEIIETFNSMPKKILQYDFIRYLALFIMGGTYSDTDTYLSRPLSQWISYNDTFFGTANEIGAVVGIEGECDCKTWQGIVSRRVQFCQWTFQSKKYHPFLAFLISNIVARSQNHYNKNTKVLSFEGKDYDFKPGSDGYYDGTMMFTGPGMFTDSVFGYVNQLGADINIVNHNNQTETWEKTKNKVLEDKSWTAGEQGNWFGWQNVTKLKEPILLNDDFVILPEVYFKGKKADKENYVEHMYKGAWKHSQNEKLDEAV